MSTTKSVEPSERCFCSRESNGNLEDRCRSGLCRTTPGDAPDVNGDGPCTQSVTTTTSPPVLESNNNVRCDNKLQYQGSSPSLTDEDDKSQESQEDVCFTSHKQSIQNRKLSKHVRKFYKKQNLLIDAYEQFYQNPADEESSLDVKTAKSAAFWSKVTFTTNCALLLAKITAAIMSGSLVVISSMLDSAMDLVSGALMWWSNRAIKKTNYYLYPRGRRKLEPVAIVVLAVIMSFVSVQVIQESLQKIVIYSTHTYDDELAAAAGWLRNASTDDGFDASSSSSKVSGTASWKSEAEALRMTTEEASVLVTSTIYSTASSSSVSLESTIQLVKLLYETLDKCASQHGAPVFGLPTILICVVTIVAKLILFLICRRIPNHSVQALAKDHFNDVISNTGAVACGIIGYHLWKFADPIGAIVISISIIINWSVTAHSQIKMLTGYTARPDFLKKVTWLALNHDDRIQYIENVIAFHFGVRYLVELKIVLPADMSLQNTHDLSEALQFKIERLPEVERAFIHTDYECDWLRRRPNQVTCSSSPPVEQLPNSDDDRCAPYVIEEDVATVEKMDV